MYVHKDNTIDTKMIHAAVPVTNYVWRKYNFQFFVGKKIHSASLVVVVAVVVVVVVKSTNSQTCAEFMSFFSPGSFFFMFFKSCVYPLYVLINKYQ